jgi:hypothetical protein
MIRSLVLTVSLCFAGAAPALAQMHPPDHAPGQPHDRSTHGPMDPEQHAAMHALLGSWHGTSSAAGSLAQRLDLIVTVDKSSNVSLKVKANRPIRAGAANQVAFQGNTLRWMQDVSGAPCQAIAVLNAATSYAPETMKGSMACRDGEITFELQKKKG